jgi:cell division protein FtsB
MMIPMIPLYSRCLLVISLKLLIATVAQHLSLDDSGNIHYQNLIEESPLQNQRRLRFALVNVHLELFHVPSSMDLSALASMEKASQVLLDQQLNADPFTTLLDVRTTVLSQKIANDDTQNLTSLVPLFTLSTSLEVTLQYQLNSEDPYLKDIESKIVGLFSSQWEFLRDLLVVLDETYFANIKSIQIGSNDIDEQNLFNQFQNPHDNETGTTNDDWGTYGLITVFVVVGVALMISCLTLLPLLQRWCRRTNIAEQETTSESNHDNKLTFSGSSWSHTAANCGGSRSTFVSSKDLGFVSTEEEEVEECPPEKDEDSSLHGQTRVLHGNVFPKTGIQAIYSDDKIQHPSILLGLRSREEGVTSKLQRTISKYRNSPDYGDLASIADSCPDVSSVEERMASTKTMHQSDQRRRDIENQIEELRSQKQAIENRIREKYEKLSRVATQNQSQYKGLRKDSGKREYLIEYAEDLLRRGDSVSTLTKAGNDDEDEEEDEPQQVFVFVDDEKRRSHR